MPIVTFARGRFPTWTPIYALVFAGSISGCASGHAQAEKQLQALREELTLTQTALDRMEERLAAVEVDAATVAHVKAPGQATAEEHTDATLSRPPLKIVKVEPDALAKNPEQTPVEGAPEAGETQQSELERPVIRGEGSRLEARMEKPGDVARPAKPRAPGRR
jgi:hypothetical protein